MLIQTVAPTVDLLDEVKDYMKVDDTNSDNTIQMLIDSKYDFAENYTNRQLKTATFELTITSLEDGFALPKNPIQSISSIYYMDENEDYQLLSPSEYYLYEEDGVYKISLSENLVTATHKHAIKITFLAGYEAIPEAIKSWICYQCLVDFDGIETAVASFSNRALDQYKVQSYES